MILNFLTKLFLAIFASVVAAISVAGLLILGKVNYGNVLFFSGFIFFGLPIFIFVKSSINYLYLTIFCCALGAVFLLTFTVTNWGKLQSILIESKSFSIESNFFLLFFLLLFFAVGFGVIAMRQDKSSISHNLSDSPGQRI